MTENLGDEKRLIRNVLLATKGWFWILYVEGNSKLLMDWIEPGAVTVTTVGVSRDSQQQIPRAS